MTVRIDVISDVVCPWCFIGQKRLDAAIAQAVDVLIEDSHAAPDAAPAPAPAASAPAMATPEPKPDPTPSEGGDSDDIGDEIQRIIASYSRARQQGES